MCQSNRREGDRRIDNNRIGFNRPACSLPRWEWRRFRVCSDFRVPNTWVEAFCGYFYVATPARCEDTFADFYAAELALLS